MSESQTSESKTSERKMSENYSFRKVIPINVWYQGINRERATWKKTNSNQINSFLDISHDELIA